MILGKLKEAVDKALLSLGEQTSVAVVFEGQQLEITTAEKATEDEDIEVFLITLEEA